MIFKKLTLFNFGLYAGTNTFDFDSDKPVILIGGMNGRGKTTFLESVLLVLYGHRSFAFLESGLSYSNYLKKLVNTADGTLQSYIELTLVVDQSEKKEIINLRREWCLKSRNINDTVYVSKNNMVDSFLSNNWEMYVEELLPSAISNFFFFDGEKISKLAVESTGERMRNSIKTLLGIDILDRLEADLDRILENKSKILENSEYYRQIQEFRAKEYELDSRLITTHRDIVEINTYNSTYQREINDLEAQFIAKGGSIKSDRATLIFRKKELMDELAYTNERLLALVATELPLALVEPLFHTIHEASAKERIEQNAHLIAENIQQLFTNFLNGSKTVTKQLEEFIRYANSTLDGKVASKGLQYGLSESALAQAQRLASYYIHDTKRHARQLQERRAKIRTEMDEIENYLLIEVDETASGAIYEKVKTLSAKIGANDERKHQLEGEGKDISSQLTQIRRELAKTIEKSLAEMERMDESERVIRYINNAILLLDEYRLRLQKQKTVALAQTMTDCYKKIVNKKNLIDRVGIHSETLDFTYYDVDGVEVDKMCLSEGEKQLMVVAMLWALALCSRNKLPVIIDTPLARLDSKHRERMVKAYFPHASEQTIILSTDTEIDDRHYSLLKPSVGKEFTLVYDDTSIKTTIVDGYFGRQRV